MPVLICPKCREPLETSGHSLICSQRHTYDVAREGYINLLLVQQKKSLTPGDNDDMVRARREFLAAGYYAPLAEKVAELVAQRKASSLLDIGCGEGYYTRFMADSVADVTGIDIAKPAVRLAAKKFPGITWLVGSGAALPLPDASVDVVTSLFSPLPVAEMARVLRDSGVLIMVTPGPRHLWTLREGLFETVNPHEPEKFLNELAPGFVLQQRHDVEFPLSLEQQALRQVLMMTPYVWKARPERRAALEALPTLQTEAQFTIFVLGKA